MCRKYFLLIFIIASGLATYGQESKDNATISDLESSLDINVFGSPATPNKDLIHPNPSEGIFHLNTVTQGDDISVFDGTGRMVFNTMGEESKMKIDITHLENGIYLVIVRDQNKKLKINQKVMIK
ncbi:MAG: T9SS type A sorting domain-containing protein [Cryomorphaceae bacterium]